MSVEDDEWMNSIRLLEHVVGMYEVEDASDHVSALFGLLDMPVDEFLAVYADTVVEAVEANRRSDRLLQIGAEEAEKDAARSHLRLVP